MACWPVDLFAKAYMCINPVTPVQTSKIYNHIYAVRTGQVNFYIIQKGGDAICIDTGFGVPVIKRELNRLHVDPLRISHVFLTHTDFDHANGASVFRNAKIYFSAHEEQMINGTTARKLGLLYNSMPAQGYSLLRDNDVVMAGAIRVKAIETPGHTPGSMSYFVDDAALFTGDAFRILDGEACPIGRIFTMDMEKQMASIRKLASLSAVKQVFTAHRGYTEDFSGLMAGYRNSGL